MADKNTRMEANISNYNVITSHETNVQLRGICRLANISRLASKLYARYDISLKLSFVFNVLGTPEKTRLSSCGIK